MSCFKKSEAIDSNGNFQYIYEINNTTLTLKGYTRKNEFYLESYVFLENRRHCECTPFRSYPFKLRLRKMPYIKIDCRLIRFKFKAGIHPKENDCFETLYTFYCTKIRPDIGDDHSIEKCIWPDYLMFKKSLKADISAIAAKFNSYIEEEIKKEVRRFPIEMRKWLVLKFSHKKNKRLREMAITVPGVITALYYLEQKCHIKKNIIREIYKMIRTSTKVNVILKYILHAHLNLVTNKYLKHKDDAFHPTQIYRDVIMGDEDIHTKFIQNQLLLIRKAPARLAPNLLLLPPPIKFIPNDIPKGKQKKYRWYNVMKKRKINMARDERFDLSLQMAIVSHLSKYYENYSWRTTSYSYKRIMEIYDYCTFHNKKPSRETEPRKLIRAARKWHKQMENATIDYKTKPELNIKFPKTLSEYKSDEIQIYPVTDSQSLLMEGHKMQHCVGSRLNLAISDDYKYFHVSIEDKEYTVEFYTGNDIFQITEMRGIRNQSPKIEHFKNAQNKLVQLFKEFREEEEEETTNQLELTNLQLTSSLNYIPF